MRTQGDITVREGDVHWVYDKSATTHAHAQAHTQAHAHTHHTHACAHTPCTQIHHMETCVPSLSTLSVLHTSRRWTYAVYDCSQCRERPVLHPSSQWLDTEIDVSGMQEQRVTMRNDTMSYGNEGSKYLTEERYVISSVVTNFLNSKSLVSFLAAWGSGERSFTGKCARQ